MKKRKWPWIAMQQWDDLLFIHWPVPFDVLRPYVPKALELETYHGVAWISLIPFQASKSRFRNIPVSLSSYLELNVRTYVGFYDEPGVYFFSMDASNQLAVMGARRLFSLPYYFAKMHVSQTREKSMFKSQRFMASSDKMLSISYRPLPRTYCAKENSLDFWLTERYCLYTLRGNHILKGPISHQPWLLQDAVLHIEKNEYLPQTYGNPLVHYSKMKKAYFHPFEIVGKFS